MKPPLASIITLNEEKTISHLVINLRMIGFDVVVEDGWSEDRTLLLAREAGAATASIKRGIRRQTMAGWKFAIDCGYERLVQIDAGGSHDYKDAKKLIDGLDKSSLVIGSRFMDGSRYIGRPWRKLCSKSMSAYWNFAMETKIRDWTSGFRAWRVKDLEKLTLLPYSHSMHAWQIEALAYAMWVGFKISEVPITYRAGRSSLTFREAINAFNVWHEL